MRRSRPPRPKERKTGNHQYPRGNPPPSRKTANASPQASETAVNQAVGTTLRCPNKGAPRSGWKTPAQNLETRRTGELPDRREEAIGDWNAAQATSRQAKPCEGRGAVNIRHTRRSRRTTTRSRLAKLIPCRRPWRPRTRRAVKIPGRATSMRTSKRMPGTGRRSVSSVTLRRICGRATGPPPTTRRAVRRRRPSSGALLARLSVSSPDDRLRRPRERDSPWRCWSPDTPGTAAGAAGKTPAPAGVTVAAQKVAAPAAVEAGHALPPDAAAEAVTRLQVLPGKRSQTSSWRTWQAPAKTDGESGEGRPPLLQATGGWETTASTPSWGPRLASRPASTARKRAGEADNRTLDRERSRERFGRVCDREWPRHSPRRAGERARSRRER